MNGKKIVVFSLLLALSTSVCTGLLSGCSFEESKSSVEESNSSVVAADIVNGGFESSDLSGWTVEYGNAFSDECVSSEKTFSFEDDAKGNKISVNATGNWYLCGKGYDGKISYANTGAIRSTSFIIPTDGTIGMKLAGGALTVGKGTGAVNKASNAICYVGVYRSSDDRMLAMQTNKYFTEHTESYVDANKYALGVYNTDNFVEYSMDLSEYAGEEAYIRIVDNDQSYYYGYISVDDIRIGSDSSAQTEGNYYIKTREYEAEAPETSIYEIKNGGFETGSLAGWTIVSGDAFSNEGVNASSVWWNENITYSRDGNYHYGMYKPSATGVMRSSEFVLGGSGYVSYKLGGCSDNNLTYIRFMHVTETGDEEIARFSNFKYYNFQFPYVANGMRLLNMIQYWCNLSDYLGETLYMEVVDNNASSDDLGCITLDSVKTYWEEKPVWYDSESYEAVYESDVYKENEYQVVNGGFETGDLTGWTLSNEEEPIGVVTADDGWWNEGFPYNKKGRYLFSGISHEGNTGTLTSSSFTVGGSGWITYLMGGGGNSALCYISILDADTGEELTRYSNRLFNDQGTALLNVGSNLANMVWYKADLSEFIGRSVRVCVTDNAVNNWGLITVDSFKTYYASETEVPSSAYLATDILTREVLGEDDEYQVLNGDFETGDFTGWTVEGNIVSVSDADTWWAENISYNKDGTYFASGYALEANTGTLTSSAFTVGGSGYITFKLGGGMNTDLCYIEIIDAESGETLARYGNTAFHSDDALFAEMRDSGSGVKYADQYGLYLMNMALYKADLSEFMGRSVKIRVVDNATSDWGLITVDQFITYYADESEISAQAILARNLNNG